MNVSQIKPKIKRTNDDILNDNIAGPSKKTKYRSLIKNRSLIDELNERIAELLQENEGLIGTKWLNEAEILKLE